MSIEVKIRNCTNEQLTKKTLSELRWHKYLRFLTNVYTAGRDIFGNLPLDFYSTNKR